MRSLYKFSIVLAGLAMLASGATSCAKEKKPDDPGVTVDAPTGLRVRFSTYTRDVIVDWDSNRQSTSYEVEIVDTELKATTENISYTFPVKDLEYGTKYTWRVRTIIDKSASQWSEGTFTTKGAPATSKYIGLWKAAPDDVDLSVTLSGSGDIDLSPLLESQYKPTEDLELEFSENEEGEDYEMLLSIPNISKFMPAGDLTDAKVKVDSEDNLSSDDFEQTEEETISFISEEYPNGIPISDIPGIADALPEGIGIGSLKGLYFQSLTTKINSVSIKGNLTNPPTNDEAEIRLLVSAAFTIKTNATGLIATLINSLLNQNVLITSTVKCKKQAD